MKKLLLASVAAFVLVASAAQADERVITHRAGLENLDRSISGFSA
jgi:hypothetical protein